MTSQSIAEAVSQHGLDGFIMAQNDHGPRAVPNGTGTPKKGHSPAASGTVTVADLHTLGPRRLERVHSASGRLRNGHTPSHSRTQHAEVRTVGEYALHHLFNSVCSHNLLYSVSNRW
jgi:furry protein family